MAVFDSATGWGWPTRLLHWVMAALIAGMLALGFYSAEIEADVYARFELAQLHKSWGFVVFSLALARIAWRLAAGRAPAPPPRMGARERRAARAAHLALYALMIAMPLTGWLLASASPLQDSFGIRNMVFGLFELPDPFVPGGEALERSLRSIHFWLGAGLTALLALHAGAALRHHFVMRDAVLTRMIAGGADGTADEAAVGAAPRARGAAGKDRL